jgi:hypothetical protein
MTSTSLVARTVFIVALSLAARWPQFISSQRVATRALVFLKIPEFGPITRFSYTVFDLAIALIVLGVLLNVIRYACRLTFSASASDKSFEATSVD